MYIYIYTYTYIYKVDTQANCKGRRVEYKHIHCTYACLREIGRDGDTEDVLELFICIPARVIQGRASWIWIDFLSFSLSLTQTHMFFWVPFFSFSVRYSSEPWRAKETLAAGVPFFVFQLVNHAC